MKLIKIIESSNPKKKYDAIFKLNDDKQKKISFGATGYRDFTLINNKDSKFYLPKSLDRNVVKDAYIRRHRSREDWNNPLTAGSLSRWLLWSKPTLKGAIKAFVKKFKL